MTFGTAFWILMLVWLLFGFYRGPYSGGPWTVWGNDLLIFVLFLLAGWKIFGAPIHG